MKKVIIKNYFDELVGEAICELNYTKDYELLIAVMLSSQTTDKRVNMVTKVLFKKYPSLEELSKADVLDIEKIIRSIGTYHKKAINVIEIAKRLVKEQDGIVPNDREYLESLKGVGHKTTNVVLSLLYNVPAIAVDTHVNRVSKRLKIAKEEDSVLDVEKKLMKLFDKKDWSNIHYQMVLFGRYYCKSINPSCDNCKLKDICTYKKR